MGRIVLLLAGLLAGVNSAGAELVLNDVNGPPFTTPAGDGFLDRIARQAFARSGVELRLVTLPPERGLLNANAGIDDGDLTRIAGLEKDYPNLIRVPEKLLDWNFSAFSRRKDLAVDGWKSLLAYNVGHIRGWKIAEANLASAAGVVVVENERQLFDVLRRDRVDVVVYSLEMGAEYLRANRLHDIYLLSPPVATREMFVYLNVKHAPLAPKIAEALRALKADGSYARAYRETVGRALARAGR